MNNTKQELEIDEEEILEIEELLRAIVLGYQQAYNAANKKNEIKFSLTITNHKIARPEGNKDCAYLRLDRSLRERIEGQGDDEGWTTQLLHNEAYYFRDMSERTNPKAPWKEQLYVNAFARLVSAGLEYAELLQKIKQSEVGKEIEPKSEQEEMEARLAKSGLVPAKELPGSLSRDDEKYKEWLASERAKENL